MSLERSPRMSNVSSWSIVGIAIGGFVAACSSTLEGPGTNGSEPAAGGASGSTAGATTGGGGAAGVGSTGGAAGTGSAGVGGTTPGAFVPTFEPAQALDLRRVPKFRRGSARSRNGGHHRIRARCLVQQSHGRRGFQHRVVGSGDRAVRSLGAAPCGWVFQRHRPSPSCRRVYPQRRERRNVPQELRRELRSSRISPAAGERGGRGLSGGRAGRSDGVRRLLERCEIRDCDDASVAKLSLPYRNWDFGRDHAGPTVPRRIRSRNAPVLPAVANHAR